MRETRASWPERVVLTCGVSGRKWAWPQTFSKFLDPPLFFVFASPTVFPIQRFHCIQWNLSNLEVAQGEKSGGAMLVTLDMGSYTSLEMTGGARIRGKFVIAFVGSSHANI